MAIIGHGVDLAEVARIARMQADHGRHFLDRCFTPGEQAYCLDHRNCAVHLAGRFAAKEAVLKVLGTGWPGEPGAGDAAVRLAGGGASGPFHRK